MIGGLLVILTWGLPLGIRVLFLAAVVAVAGSFALADRRLWPWQQVIQDVGLRARRDLGLILGTVRPSTASKWLRAHPAGPVWDRYRVLGFIGQDEAAEDLIPSMPTGTAQERFDLAWAELGRQIRLTGDADPAELWPLLDDLDPADREGRSCDLAWAGGLLAVARGERLDRLDAPHVHVTGSGRLSLWWSRYWIARRTIGGMAIGVVVLVLRAW